MSTLAPPPPKKPRASDVRRRAVLPTTLQNLHAAANASTAAGAGPQLQADDFLDKVEEELNRKVDHDVDVLVEGMAELVKVHQVSLPSLPALLQSVPSSGWKQSRARRRPDEAGSRTRGLTGPAPIFVPQPARSHLSLPHSAQIEGKDHFRVTQDAFQAEVRTESMVRRPRPRSANSACSRSSPAQIRAAHSLLSLSHTLKLLHLFADTATPAAAREARSATLDEEIARAKKAVGDLVGGQSGRGAP